MYFSLYAFLVELETIKYEHYGHFPLELQKPRGWCDVDVFLS